MQGSKFKPKYDPETATFLRLYQKLVKRHKEKSDEEVISFIEFKDLSTSSCHYCGAKPNREIKYRYGDKKIIVNGIDRVDNSRGYETGNVVTCCSICNIAKHDMKHSDFITWLKRIYENYVKETDK